MSRSAIISFWCVTNGLFNLKNIRQSHKESIYNNTVYLWCYCALGFILKRLALQQLNVRLHLLSL